MIFALVLCWIFATLWVLALFSPTDDDAARARYEAERAAFERMFE